MNSANAPSGSKPPKFSIARRGFEKEQVEAYLDEMRATHDKLASSAALAERRLTDASARLQESEFRLTEATERITELESEVADAKESEARAPSGSMRAKATIAPTSVLDRSKKRHASPLVRSSHLHKRRLPGSRPLRLSPSRCQQVNPSQPPHRMKALFSPKKKRLWCWLALSKKRRA